jgi:hypothetical protein
VWLEYYQLADADGTPESVTALAAASSGNVMAVGCASSAVLQLTRTMTEVSVVVLLLYVHTIDSSPAP